MNRRLLFIVLPLLMASTLVPLVGRGHGSGYTGTGLVCITASTAATNCPSSPAILGPLTMGATFSIGVFINNSMAMGGFDIYVSVDPGYLHPTSAALGSLIASPSLTSICLNGSPSAGSCTIGTANGPGVVEVTTIESSGSNECGGNSPCSGMAFTITYQVLASISTTPLSYPTAAGCSASSVSSPPDVCVEVADSIGNVLPETTQAATVKAPGLVSVVRGSDDMLYWNGLFTSSWNGWQSLGTITSAASPTLCSSGPGGVELVARGTNDVVYHKSFSVGAWSSSWDNITGGFTIDRPACTVLNGVLYVAVRGSDNGVYVASRPLPTGSWSSWTFLDGFTQSAPALVATNSSSRLDIVVRGSDDGIYHMAFTSGAWSMAWDTPDVLIHNQTPDVPVAVSDGTSLQVVVRGENDGVYYNQYSFSSKSWLVSGWLLLDGFTASAPALIVDSSSGAIQLAVRGMDNGLYHKTFSGGVWSSSWDSPGGSTVGQPSLGIIGPSLAMVVTGSDSAVYYNTLSSSVWSGWTLLAGTTPGAPGLFGV